MDEQIKANEKLIIGIIFQFYKTRSIKVINIIVKKMAMDFQDVLQIGRIAYFKAMQSYDNEGGFNGYFACILHNDLKMLARKQGQAMRQAEVQSLDFSVEIGGDDVALSDMIADETDIPGDTISKMIYESLNELDRTILVMSVNGYSTYKIGEHIGRSQRNTCKHLHRIKAKLREELSV